jgi:phosphate:Na+ symporter
MADQFGVDDQPVLFLALFHTVFNVLGAVIMLPFAKRLAKFLEKFFRKAEEDMGRPQHLDKTLISTPELAVSALRAELIRLRCLVNGIVRSAISRDAAKPAAVEAQSAALRTLGAAIISFISRVHTESMPLDVADKLAQALRISRYLDEAARLTPSVPTLRAGVHRLANASLQTALAQTLTDAEACVSLADCGEETSGSDAERTAVLNQFETTYQHAKAALLAAAAVGGFSVEATVALLDHLSATRRMVEQLVKADRLLDSSRPSIGMEEANTPPQSPQPEAEL